MIHRPAPTAIHAPAPARPMDGWRTRPTMPAVVVLPMADDEECRLWDAIAATRAR